MKNIFKKVFVLLITVFVLFSSKNVFSAGFNDYINSIKESSVKEAAIGACKNVCGAGYYQLKFGLPFQKMSRCACVPLNQGAGALMTSFVQFLLSSVGVISVIILIVAGFMMAFAAGNANTISTAKSMIKNAFIGLIAVIFSGSALAIINPDLVDLGIFSSTLGKIDVECVDDTKDKSDGTADGYYINSTTKKTYKKNCNNVCVNSDCVVPKNTTCMCALGSSSQKLKMDMCTESSCGSDSYCDVSGGTRESTRISGKCYSKLENGKTCVRGSDYSCISGYCDDRGYCNSPTVNGNACTSDFGCWQYKTGSKICIIRKCLLPADCKNADFTCYNEFCVPEYNKCFNGDIMKCGASSCSQEDPY